jgi:hypothetical protein
MLSLFPVKKKVLHILKGLAQIFMEPLQIQKKKKKE